jgi:hypothetical protein
MSAPYLCSFAFDVALLYTSQPRIRDEGRDGIEGHILGPRVKEMTPMVGVRLQRHCSL